MLQKIGKNTNGGEILLQGNTNANSYNNNNNGNYIKTWSINTKHNNNEK